jgi:hypothetical protein
MKPKTVRIGILALGIAVSGVASAADPVTTLLGLVLAEKASGPSDFRARKDIPSWRLTLSQAELSALESMQNHPAVAACIKAADNSSPVASYHCRKLAEFAVDLNRYTARHSGKMPDILTMDYERAAKAFQWCSTRAGTAEKSAAPSLEQYARSLARVVYSSNGHNSIIASSKP